MTIRSEAFKSQALITTEKKNKYFKSQALITTEKKNKYFKSQALITAEKKNKYFLFRKPSWYELLGVEEDDIRDCCYRMICLYQRKKVFFLKFL